MGAGHHHHDEQISEARSRRILTALWINATFVLIEVIGGFVTNSIAVLSDALHDLGDCLSLGLAWYFYRKSQQIRDHKFTYGYRRFSLLGAFLNCLVLTLTSVFIIQESVRRLFDPEQPEARGMVLLALVGIIANGLAFYQLKGGKSLNEKAVSLHFVEDILGWLAVLVGSIVMLFANVPWLDAVLSLLISGYILWNVYKTLRSVFIILLQSAAPEINEDQVRKTLLKIPGVIDIHDLHTWTMDGAFNVLTAHVVVEEGTPPSTAEDIKHEIRHGLQHLKVQHVTIELEFVKDACRREHVH